MKLRPDSKLYLAILTTLFIFIQHSLNFTVRFIIIAPSLTISLLFTYMLYHPDIISTLTNAEALQALAVTLSHNRTSVINLALTSFTFSLLMYLFTFKLDEITDPLFSYFFRKFTYAAFQNKYKNKDSSAKTIIENSNLYTSHKNHK
jgi:hypothetical protein